MPTYTWASSRVSAGLAEMAKLVSKGRDCGKGRYCMRNGCEAAFPGRNGTLKAVSQNPAILSGTKVIKTSMFPVSDYSASVL
jgi:hypothetical protein